MGIRINTNIFSLLINRNLQRSSSQLETSYKRLSTGDKINQAGDDPAGLANSHALRAKIAGLQRNLINSNEGLNITNVAESGLSNITDILQRLTELSVQCSSETVNADQRLLVQKEVDQQLAEIQRIATTANYNDKNLLDGTFVNLRLQVGTRMDQSIPVSIRSAQTSTLGLTASVTGTSGVDANAITGVGDLTINGQTVPASVADGISIVNNTASAIAKAAAINSITNLTNVTATANPTVVSDAAGAISNGAIDGVTSTLTINGTSIGAITFLPNDSDGRLREKINSYSTLTGVTASLGANGQLETDGERWPQCAGHHDRQHRGQSGASRREWRYQYSGDRDGHSIEFRHNPSRRQHGADWTDRRPGDHVCRSGLGDCKFGL